MAGKRRTRHLTLTVDGDEREATWKQGVGIYVGGHNFGKGDTVEIDDTPHEVTKMHRMVMKAVTLVNRARKPG